jgi:3-hydroxyisobutyrate dehydrogenase-like beta-hydroxyacid dehydrogenase
MEAGAGSRGGGLLRRLVEHLPSIAVLGLGEAGSAIARDLLAAGARVRGFDPVRPAPEGVGAARDATAAAAGADVVVSVNSASVALDVAQTVAPVLEPERLFADLNTAAPTLKRAIAAIVEDRAAYFADVALLRGVPDRGIGTPSLVSGTGAGKFAATFERWGMPVTEVGGTAGEAAALKLARSVFMKGLAAAVDEALAAGERLGQGEWLRRDIEATLTAADASLVRRLVEGSRVHALRRVEEMNAAVAMLEELEVETRIAAASEEWLRSLAGSEVRR